MRSPIKALFSSTTRVKLLSTFLLHPEEEYYIRELTRLLSEQINSVRRELMNLKQIGLVTSRSKNRKKFYRASKDFPFFADLQSLFSKAIQGEPAVVLELKRLPGLRFLVLTGSFVGEDTNTVDLLLVGEVQNKDVESILQKYPGLKNVKYSIFSKADFLYRLHLKDRFIRSIIERPTNIIALNSLGKEVSPRLLAS
jgi:DNA-binding transcriptional ArsR family regulator